MRVLLIGLEPYFAAIGIRYLSSYLRKEGHDPYIVISPKPRPTFKRPFLETESEKNALVTFARELDVRVIGISLMTHHFARASALTRAFKGKLPVPVIWGGVHPTSVPAECAAEADFVCIGEGEIALAEFVSNLESGRDVLKTPGFAYMDNGKVVRNELPFIIGNLDDVPIIELDPDRMFFLEGGRVVPLTAELYRKYSTYDGTWYRLTTCRGCPYKCTYCAVPVQKIRRRSVTNVMEEITLVKELYPFTEVLNIQDDSFILGDDEWLRDFSERLRSEFGLEFMCRVVPRYVTEGRVKTLYEGGLRYVSMGLESGSDRINREVYGRPETAAGFLKADRIFGDYDVYKAYDVIVDNPYETEAETLETVRTLAMAGKPFILGVYSLTPYPGTPFYDRVKRDGKLGSMTDAYESPFQVTQPGRYRTSGYLIKLIYCTILFPRWLVLYLANRADRRWTLGFIDRLFNLHQRYIGELFALKQAAPVLFATVAKAVRRMFR
ncbi:MAG: B12-binding domain-containing radical SAM protein [Candidatus Coatesbacteria bacterium]|nr:MAG: B12-binding domain-containing radical SAM protein [Candidatus Coatesbacteria bacterium]